MDLKKDKISVLTPAFNEENNILLTVKETISVFDNLEIDYEVIIIDDGSCDNTYQMVKNDLGRLNGKVKIEKYIPNQGKGFAIKYKFKIVEGPIFLKPTRNYGRIGIKDIINILQDTLAVFYRLYFRIYYG